MTSWLGALVVVLALAVSAGGGWPVTRAMLRLASRSSDAGSAPSPPASPAPRAKRPESAADPADPTHAAAPAAPPASGSPGGPEGPAALAALRGGTWIGILERLATTGSLLVGEPTGIAVVVAIKGLGRYPELRENPAASERFVVGTLASLTWAAALGFLGRRLLTG